jgi:chorismate mutase
MDLEELRKKINKIDNDLISLLFERTELSRKVAEYKKENNLEIYQPQREKEIIKEKRKLAEENNLDAEFIENLFKLIMENSKKIQEKK